MTGRENLFLSALVDAYRRRGRPVSPQTLEAPAAHFAREIPCEDGEIAPMFAEAARHGIPTKTSLLTALRALEAKRHREVPTPDSDGMLYGEYVRLTGFDFIRGLTGPNWREAARKYCPENFSTKENANENIED